MAATVQSDPYSVFIRKIGYSVGLENSLSRVGKLVKLYCGEGELTPATWGSLVHSPEPIGWGLESDHIADFFKSIDLIQRQKTEIAILPGLDAMALAHRELGAEELFDVALRVAFASGIVLADGDIFLNFLAGEFERDRVEPLLRSMIVSKRQAIKKLVKVAQLLERIFRVVSIDVQHSNVGGAAVGKTLSDRNRTEALRPRTTPLNQVVDEGKVEISDDYFRKVSGRRRDWARSLGLCDTKGKLSASGISFLDSFKRLGIETAEGAFAYWPFSIELDRLAISSQSLGVPGLDLWSHLIAIRRGLNLDGPGFAKKEMAGGEVEELVRRLYKYYRALNSRREMLRKEMPLSVLYTSIMAIYSARQTALPEMPKALAEIVNQPGSNFLYRASRNYEGTVYVKG